MSTLLHILWSSIIEWNSNIIVSWRSQEAFSPFYGSSCHHSTFLPSGNAGRRVFPEHCNFAQCLYTTTWQKWKLSFLVRCAAVLHPEFRIQDLLLIMPINTTAILPVEPLGLSYKSLQGWDKKEAKGENWQEKRYFKFFPFKKTMFRMNYIFLLHTYFYNLGENYFLEIHWIVSFSLFTAAHGIWNKFHDMCRIFRCRFPELPLRACETIKNSQIL